MAESISSSTQFGLLLIICLYIKVLASYSFITFIVDASERDQAVAVESHRYFAMCRLCGERFRSCVFLPCRHILFCWNCGQHFWRCDECQLDIVRRMHVDMGRSLPKEE